MLTYLAETRFCYEDKSPKGIVTERDFVRRVMANLRVLKDRPISFLVTDSECIFSSSPLLQIPHEVVWSFEQSIVKMFWLLAEEIWNKLSESVI
jgi:hypothetical protein